MTSTFVPEITAADVRCDAPSELALRVIAGAESVTRMIRPPRSRKLGRTRMEVAQSVQARRVPIVGQREVRMRIPVTSGCDLPTLIGVAVRSRLLKRRGSDALRQFVHAHAALSTGDTTELR